MKMTFRWYGEDDPISLDYIRQIPGMKGIVTAIYDIPVGEIWDYEKIKQLKNKVEEKGLSIEVIESVPVHEDIKLGLSTRDKYIENYKQTILNLGKAGIKVICYNFMPVFDWTRTSLNHELEDGSKVLIYEEEIINKIDPINESLELPGWDKSYKDHELKKLIMKYQSMGEEQLWHNFKYFLERIIPAAEEADVKMAVHPDDPPWSIFGIPRIIKDCSSIDRLINLVNSPNNGICLCSGSLGANIQNNIPKLIRNFGRKGRIHFIHARNIKITGSKSFQEASHRSEDGSLDMYEIMKAIKEIGYSGPLRPDHGRSIWGEKGTPGYGLYDRALGAAYLNGIWEGLSKEMRGGRDESSL